MYSRQRTISTHSNSSNGNGNSARPALVPKLQQPVTLSESVQVTVRCRPPKKDELNNCWNLSDNKISSEDPKLKKQHQFTFDNVFYGSNNTELYSKSVERLINQAMEGFNATVFAYGQTASGKTFTMMGTETEPGVIPRSVDNVFSFIKKAVTREFLLRVSYLEIYNESIRDLLNPSNTNLKIQQDKIRGVYVTPLTEEVVTSPQDVLNIISQGEANRHISSTDYNLHSSRSHTLFQMIIESREKTNSTSTTYRRTLTQSGYGVKSKERVKISQLNLIDLAGSEKAATNEDRRKEGSYINKSLLTLGTVISKLTETSGNKSPGHIPFRDSKLTRILQTALTGLAKVAVICTISPALQSIEESLNTLKFATRVKKISIHAKNDDVMDDKALIQKYRNEILQLKTKLKEQEDNGGLSQNERRDHEQTLKQMRGVRDTLKERIDQLTKLILTSASIVVQQNDQDDIVIVEANPSHIKKEQSAVIYQLEQQVKKLSIDSHQKDERIQQLEHQLRLQSAISAQLETALSITKAELEVNQLKTPISERKYYLGSPPQEEESSF